MSANSVFNNRFTTKTVFVQDRLLEKRNHSSFLCETKIKLPKTRANQQKKTNKQTMLSFKMLTLTTRTFSSTNITLFSHHFIIINHDNSHNS